MLSPQLSAHSQDRLFPAIDWISHETSSIIRPTDSSSLGRVYVPVFFFFNYFSPLHADELQGVVRYGSVARAMTERSVLRTSHWIRDGTMTGADASSRPVAVDVLILHFKLHRQ